MDIEEGIKRINGVLEVEIQGFFTERFINLCKINNIKIWNIKNIVSGIIRFNISIKDFKKLKPIARKTKCKIKIVKKQGMYFNLFRYRKRKIVYILVLMLIFLCILSTTFIWDIEIVGNENISKNDVLNCINNSGLYVGKNKIGLKTKNIINELRINIPGVAWAGIEIDGTKAVVKIVEKTSLNVEDREDGTIGDIVSTKSGVIEKIVVENGTAIQREGDYVEEGRILIEGKVYSKIIDTKDVKAKGKVILKTNYYYNNKYSFKEEKKNYTGKKRFSIGLTINDRENYIKYLDKSLNYDIIKHSYNINIFGIKFSIDWYVFNLYDVEYVDITEEDIIQKAKNDAELFIKNVTSNLKNPQIISNEVIVKEKSDDFMDIEIIYTLNEEDGVYRKRN